MTPFPYRDVFLAVEQRLIEAASQHMAADTVRAELDHYKHFEGRDLSDDQYFSILVFVAFYSGFRAATVTSKKKIIEGHFPGWKQVALYTESDIIKILADRTMIAHERKIRGCVENAKQFGKLISQHGSNLKDAGSAVTLRAPDEATIAHALAAAEAPLQRPPGDVEAVREALYTCMWDDVGILRTAERLALARVRLADLDAQLDAIGVDASDRAFNFTWHDWLNLKNLIQVSRVITEAAMAREDSRGAHFREDFPAAGDLPTSTYTVARMTGDTLTLTREAVQFTRVRPGKSLLTQAAAAT